MSCNDLCAVDVLTLYLSPCYFLYFSVCISKCNCFRALLRAFFSTLHVSLFACTIHVSASIVPWDWIFNRWMPTSTYGRVKTAANCLVIVFLISIFPLVFFFSYQLSFSSLYEALLLFLLFPCRSFLPIFSTTLFGFYNWWTSFLLITSLWNLRRETR